MQYFNFWHAFDSLDSVLLNLLCGAAGFFRFLSNKNSSYEHNNHNSHELTLNIAVQLDILFVNSSPFLKYTNWRMYMKLGSSV